MFHLYVASVDRNVAHVAVAIHVYFKCMFQMFHLVFQTYACQCFYLDVAYIFHTYEVFSGVFLKCFIRMF
jgi:hypothetical protein